MSADLYDDEPRALGPLADNDAERYVLGCWLSSTKALDDPDAHLEPSDFHAPRHEVIAATIQTMHGRGLGVDPVTVAAELLRTGAMAQAGGAPYLHELYAVPSTTSNAAHYARIVRGLAVRREGVAACTRGIQMFRSGEGDPADVHEAVRAEIDAIGTSRTTTAVRLVGEEIDAYIDALEADEEPGIPTPWADLNERIGGWKPGRLYVIGARPSVGKSVMGEQAALGMARHGHTGFYSLEMSRDEVITRAVAQIGTVPLDRLEKPKTLTDDDWARISRARAILDALPLAIEDRATVRPVDIRAHARTLSRRGPLAGLVVDYLQLMAAPRGDKRSRQELVAEWSRQFKLLAKELAVPVIVISQLNREIEHRADPRPVLADLRESGAIEQDADVVILLHPIDPDGDGPDAGDLLVGVPKNRQGKPGALRLQLEGQYARLRSKANAWQTPPDRYTDREDLR